jgi:hypothetical protein
VDYHRTDKNDDQLYDHRVGQVFISYSHCDAGYVGRLTGHLARAGHGRHRHRHLGRRIVQPGFRAE